MLFTGKPWKSGPNIEFLRKKEISCTCYVMLKNAQNIMKWRICLVLGKYATFLISYNSVHIAIICTRQLFKC